MKRMFLAVSIVICACPFAFAQDVTKLPAITVTGTAEIQIAPDQVSFSLDVTKRDMDLQVAKRLNDESVSKILELMRRLSVPPQNVKTHAITVEMKYVIIRDPKAKMYDEDGDETGKRVFKGYEVSKTVSIKLTDITRFESVFEEILKTGVTEVRNVNYESSKYRETRVQAREMAMKAAREKAVSMATAINQSIGKAISIQEGVGISGSSTRGYSNAVSMGVPETESITTTFAPGAIKVEASVTVAFLLN